MTSLTERRRAWRRGHWAERLCAAHLRLRGYRVIARRLRTPAGEIDLIARRGGTLAIVEVKARPDETAAAEAITARQRARILDAARWFLAGRPDLAGLSIRFDAMLVTPRRWPRHLADAWRPES
jgi:putative endonuclease